MATATYKSLCQKTVAVTLYRVRDDRLQVAEFQFTKVGHPYQSFYERKLGDETEMVYVSYEGRIQYDWFTDRAAALTNAVEKAENRVEACEERLREARERLLAVQGLKR